MSWEAIYNLVVNYLVDQCQVPREQVTPEVRLQDLQDFDSLDMVELFMHFEDELESDIDDQKGKRVQTVRDLVDVLYESMHR